MIATKVKVDASKLTAFIPQYLAETKRSIKAGTISIARTVAQELVKYTPPFDRNNFTSHQKAKKAGEGALERDIRKVYWHINKLFGALKNEGKLKEARIIRKLVTSGEYSKAEELLKTTGIKERNVQIGLFDGGKAHKQSRNRRGRVSRHVPALIVINRKGLDEYIKAKKKMVGFSRGGWLTGASGAQAMPRKMPVWVKRWQGKSPGHGSQSTRRGFAVRITNDVTFASSSISPSRINSALKDAEAKLRKQMEIIVAHRNRKV
jgi:hypothetical protein